MAIINDLEYKNLNELVTEFESTTYGNKLLDDGDVFEWAKASPMAFDLTLEDINREYRITGEQAFNILNAPQEGQITRDFIGGLKSLEQTAISTYRGLEIAKLQYFSPDMKKEEVDKLLTVVGRQLITEGEEYQRELEKANIDPESWAFGIGNVLGQVAITTLAGLATGGAAAPLLIGATMTAGSKKAEYAARRVEEGVQLREQPLKDDVIALGLGAVEGILGKYVGVERLFSKVATKGAVTDITVGAFGEGLEEALQEPIEFLGNKVAGYEDRTYGELFNDSLKSAVLGAIGGGTAGTGIYLVHRNKIQKVYEDMGHEPTIAKEKAIETIDEGKKAVLQEMKTRSELQLHYGEAYTQLEDKIKAQIKATGQEQNIGGDIDEYVQKVARKFANTLLNFANLRGVPTQEILDLADIEQEGNILRLNTPDMKDEVELRRQLKDKKEKAKALKTELERKKAKKLGVEGKTDEETSVNLKIDRLEKQLSKVTSDIELADKTEQLKALREEITRIKAEKEGIEADTQRETALNLQTKTLEKRLQRIKEEKDITDKKRVAKGLPKANTHAKTALRDGQKITAGVNRTNFIETLTKKDRANLTNADGSINNVALQRKYNDAILAKIINDNAKFERLILSGNIPQEALERIVNSAEDLTLFNESYGEYRINEDITEALSFLENTTKENFAQKMVTSELEQTFGSAAIAHILLNSENNLSMKQFIDLYQDGIEINGTNKNPLVTKNDIMAETLRYLPMNIDKFNDDGSTNDIDLLAVYSNVNNIRQEDIIPDESGIYPMIYKEAQSIKEMIDTYKKARTTEKGQSLSTFIRGLGGIYDYGGELATRGIKGDIAKKGRFNKKGVRYQELDYVIEAAFDNGYFPDKTSADEISHDEMLDAIERDYTTEKKIRPQGELEANKEIAEIRDILSSLEEIGINTEDNFDAIAMKLQQYYIDNEIPLEKQLSVEDMPEYLKNIPIEEFELYQTDINSDAFKNWFKDSKVIDENGEPLVVYHGSRAKISVFDTKKISSSGDYGLRGKGFYFSTNKRTSENYGENISKVYLSIKNPFDPFKFDTKQKLSNYLNVEEDTFIFEPNKEFKALKPYSSTLTSAIKDKGHDGIFYPERQEIIAFEPTQIKSVDNRGTFDPETANIYMQRRKEKASYNPKTKEIILGKGFNSMSLPHEMAHFWLDTIFQDVTLWRGGAKRNRLYESEIGQLWEFLGVKDTQKALTRDQHEQFATLTEQYLTQRTTLPAGTEFAVHEFLNFIPEAYNSFLDFGYIDSNNKKQNPAMTITTKEWFDRFFTNWGVGDTPSPEVVDLYTPTIEPKKMTEQREIETTIEKEVKEQKNSIKKTIEEADERTPNEEKIQIAAKREDYEQRAKDALLPSEEPEEGRFSFLRFGRGTNTKETGLGIAGMFKEANKWIAKNPELAFDIATGDPRFIENESPIDRGILIQAYKKQVKNDKTLEATLETRLAFYKSLYGTGLGLNQKTSHRLFLEGIGKAENLMLNKYLLKRYGKKANSAELLERELDRFVKDFAPRIIGKNELQQASEIKNMIKEAEKIFGKEADLLFQSEFPKSVLRDESKFLNFAKNLIKKHSGALPSDSYMNDLMQLATRAQMAAPNLNSDDIHTAIAAAREIRAYQDFLIETEIPLSLSDKIIGGFFSRSMLSSPSTHIKNLLSNSFEIPVVKTALTAKYGKNEVSKKLIKEEAEKITRIYEETQISLPQMHTLNDRSLIAGEIYRIQEKGNITVAGVKMSTLGKTKIPDPLALLGRSDLYFRQTSYLQALAHIASAKARETGRNADEVFKELKQIGKKETDEARQEAIFVSNVSVFTQNGELARLVGSIRKSLDDYTAPAFGGYQHGLGTIVAPFAKTPSNIIQLGAEALASPFSIARTKLKGGELSVKQYIDITHLATAATIAATVLATGADYEPPYIVGQRYDQQKHYDSIKLGNTWVKIDSLGTLEIPLRLIISVKDRKTWTKAVEGSIDKLPIDFGGLKYAITNPKKGVPYFIESQLTKGIPAATSLTRPIVRETGLELSTYGKIGSRFAKRLGLDGRENTINDWIHMLASFVSVGE